MDFPPPKKKVIFYSYVRLPEGNYRGMRSPARWCHRFGASVFLFDALKDMLTIYYITHIYYIYVYVYTYA